MNYQLTEGKTMTETVTYTMLCKNCNGKSEYVMRGKTINSDLSDNDIMFIIHHKPDYEYSNCKHCNLITKQEYISFNTNVDKQKAVKDENNT